MKRTREIRRTFCAVGILCILFLYMTVAFAQSKTAVIRKTVEMYKTAQKQSESWGAIEKGEEVTVLAIKGKIANIRYRGKTGYVAKSALKLVKAQATPAPAPQKTQAPSVKKKTTVNDYVYKSANLDAKRSPVRKGTTVLILDEVDGDWLQVRRGGAVGYMQESAFEPVRQTAAPSTTPSAKPTPSPKPTPTPEPDVVVTREITRTSKVYRAADTDSPVVGRVAAGTCVVVLKEGKKFVQIRRNNSTGYVPVSAFEEAQTTPVPTLAATPEATATPKPTATPLPTATPKPSVAPTRAPVGNANSSKAERVISAAMAQLGKPYVYGRTGMSSFDCSGLTRYAYGQVGITLPHSAYSVGYNSGTRVTRSQLQRGDIVCFNTITDSDQSDHVGIYLGNNQFVHASSGQGRVVVSALTGYYNTAFSWGRRVL